MFKETKVNVTIEGHKYLGGVVGSDEYKTKYADNLVKTWVGQIERLSIIAKSEPHAAAFISGLIHKFTYHLRTIENLHLRLQPVEDAIANKLIPSLTEDHKCNENERRLLSLPVRLGGLAIPILTEIAQAEVNYSKLSCSNLKTQIIQQHTEIGNRNNKPIKAEISRGRRSKQKNTLDGLRSRMNALELRANDLSQRKGASSWLTTILLADENFCLSKREFFDAISVRYRWPLKYLPTTCACNKSFSIDHALSCPKGGFVYQRHNEIRDLLSSITSEVCHGVQIEPALEELTGEKLKKGAITTDGARADFSARGFWTRGQRAFFDVRVFNPFAQRYLGQSVEASFAVNEKEKKKNYNQRILEVDRGSFTPLVENARHLYRH